MKEALKAVWRILKIVLVFFLFLGIVALTWYAIETAAAGKDEPAVPFVDFILYLLGFGEVDSRDHYLQTAFSMLGLFAVTLLSSVFTVSLFDLRSKVRISPEIIVESRNRASLKLNTAGKDVYNLTATLIAKCGQDITTEEELFPFIPKKATQKLSFEIAPGTPIYKYLRASYLKAELEPQLILTVSYTDIESGQEYTMAQKYQYSTGKSRDILFGGDEGCDCNDSFEAAIQDYITGNTFKIDLSSIWPCEAEDIDISYGYQDLKCTLSHKQAFRAKVHMNSSRTYEPQTFTMAVTNDLLGNDWTTYYDLGCALKFDYMVDDNITVTMELKYGVDQIIKYEQRLRPTSNFRTCVLKLQRLRYEELRNVRELCFTVFYKDVDPEDPTGSFIIKNCVLEVEAQEDTPLLRSNNFDTK
ncbi:MAG: hypothetical protein E7453_05545 [Ruminococcaceae bacterium]|nr:hypothetical protein [Oscillospiraceae bacterium]